MSDLRITHEGHIAIIELARPPNNFFDKALISDLAAAFEAVDQDTGIRCIVLCADGKNFCAGANFADPRANAAENFRGEHLYHHAVRLFRCQTPVVAAVQGSAIGGGLGLALVADFRIASPESRFAANFARIGIHPGFGLSVTLPRVIGQQQATMLFYTGQRIGGAHAHTLGLVDRLVPHSEIRTAALALATELAQSAPLALVSIRKTLRQGLADHIALAVEHELAEQKIHFETADFTEGTAAMQQRRPPNFTGR